MRDTTQHIDSFNSSLGLIDLTFSIEQNNEKVRFDQKGNRIYLETIAHRIEVIGFQDVKDWLLDTNFSIADSKGWIIRITKLNEIKESLTFKCYMDRNSEKVKSEVDCGVDIPVMLTPCFGDVDPT